VSRWLFGGCLLLATAAHADPAAWRVATPGGGQLLLLGSVHYLREEDYPLPPRVDALYAQADELVMELDLDDLDPQQARSAFLSAALLPADTSLSDAVAPAVYRRARHDADALGIALAAFDRYEPWLAAISILDVGMQRQGYRSDKGLEQYLLRKARRDGKDIRGLESLDAQIRLFDGLPPRQQQALLAQTLDELGSAAATMGGLVRAWRGGDVDALTASLMQDFRGFPGLYDTLVRRRNAAWMPALKRLLTHPRSYLVVVGALHLIGKGSVIELLEKDGYRVTKFE
jgi:uncharacterized protein YbaP (TraB family)